MPRELPPLPSTGIPGVYCYVEKDRGRYCAEFRRNGREKKVRLESTNPSLAFKELIQKATDFEAGRYDPWTHHLKQQSVDQAVKRYLKHIEPLSPATVEQRTTVLEAFAESLPHNMRLASLEYEHAQVYYTAARLRPSSQKTYYSILKTWLNWCVDHGMLTKSPLHKIPAPYVPRVVPPYFKPAQYRAFMKKMRADILLKQTTLTGAAARNGIEDYPDMADLFVTMGFRRMELLTLTYDQIDFRTRFAEVRTLYDEEDGLDFEPKDSDTRLIPIPPTAMAILKRRFEARRDESDLVFPSPRTGRVRAGREVSRQFKAYIRLAKLPERLRLHSLRHTYASWLVSGGTPLEVVQKWMGHASLEQTQVYAALLPSALKWRGSSYHDEALSPRKEAGKLGGYLGGNVGGTHWTHMNIGEHLQPVTKEENPLQNSVFAILERVLAGRDGGI